MELWYVVYEVEGFAGEQRRGPWPKADAREQADDIGGFERVTDVRLEMEPKGEEPTL